MNRNLSRSLAVIVALGWTTSAWAADIRITPGPRALEKAQREVRALLAKNGGEPPQGGITVVLADGTYCLTEPLVLTSRDSGSASAPVVWRAEHRGKAAILGVAAIKEVPVDWSSKPASLIPPSARSHVRCWALPEGEPLPGFYGGGCCARPKLSDDAVCVFSGGLRAVPARWPNAGFAKTGEPIGDVQNRRSSFGQKESKIDSGVFRLKDAPLAAWAVEPDLWAYGMYGVEWSDISSPVLKADPVAGTLAVEPSKNKYGFLANMPFYVFNSFSDLDSEGEWAIDRKARRVYLWGHDARPPLIAGIATLLKGRDVSHVAFEGLFLGVARGTAVALDAPNGVTFRACCVLHIGGDGMHFTHAKNCLVQGCDFYDLGKAGVIMDGGDTPALVRGDNAVDNCHIHHYGRIIPNYNPGVSLLGCGNRATHNLIHHASHQGIYFNGNDHYIGFNVCHDCCSYTDDAGTIYCCMRDWTKRGTVIEYNAIHMTGKQPLAKHVNGIYLDDWSSGVIVRGNIINRAPKGVYVGGGNANVVTRNILINTPIAVSIGSRGLDSFAKETTRQGEKSFIYSQYLRDKPRWSAPPWAGRYPHLAELETLPTPIDAHNANFNEVSNNVCVATGGVDLMNEAAIRARTTLADNLERADDPGFADYAGFDWELRPDSSARKVLGGGTRFGEMGLYASEARFSPAVRHGADMTPPRPFAIEPEPSQPSVFISVDKRKQCHWQAGVVSDVWSDFSFSFTPDASGRARMRLMHKAGCARTEYANPTVNGKPVTGPDDNLLFDVTQGVAVTVTFRARMMLPIRMEIKKEKK